MQGFTWRQTTWWIMQRGIYLTRKINNHHQSSTYLMSVMEFCECNGLTIELSFLTLFCALNPSCATRRWTKRFKTKYTLIIQDSYLLFRTCRSFRRLHKISNDRLLNSNETHESRESLQRYTVGNTSKATPMTNPTVPFSLWANH